MPSPFCPETGPEPSSLPNDPAAQAAHSTATTEELLAILDALPTPVGLVRDHRAVWVNPAFATLLGYELEDARRLPTSTYFHDLPRLEAAMRQAESILVQGSTYKTDVLMRRKNGECLWVEASGRLLSPGNPDAGMVWILTDISERNRAENNLRMILERFEAAQAQARLGSWELGPDLEARYWSKQMYELHGFDPEQGLPPCVIT